MSRPKKRTVVSVARTYANVNAERPASYWNYEDAQIQWGFVFVFK